MSIDLNTDSDSDPDADDAVRPDAALAPRRAVERAAELTAENARLRSLLDESDARAARAEARLRDALDPSLVAYRAAADGALDLDLVTRDAAASLQREIQSQDAILREYQRENEAAAATLADAKRLAADVESKLRAELADAADESARLRIRLEAAGGSSATLEPSADAGDASTPSSATEANARHAGTRNKPPSAMAEALARHLEAEKRAASREAELRDALESTRAELREAENGASLDALRIALEEERARREAETSELAALRERVEWFTENQRLTTDADETARRRAATVESLERRLARADRELAKLKGFGFGKRAGKNATRTTDTSDANAEESALSRRDRYAGGTLERKSRRTKRDDVDVANATSSASTSSAKATPADPRDQSSAGVAALLGGGSSFSSTPFPPDVDVGGSAAFDAGLARRPDSVAALVRAVRPTEDHAGKMAELEARCRRLRDELDAADAARERALRALQVEHLRLKSGMEKRVAAAEAAEATAKKRAATAARLERETRELRGALERRTTKANAERKRADAAERRLRERGGDVVDDAKTERRGGDAETDAEQRPADDSDADGDASGDENADANRNDGEYRRGGTNAHETATPPEGHPAITPFDPSRFRSTSHRDVDLANTREKNEKNETDSGDAGETARRSGEVNFDDVKNADVDAEVSGTNTPRVHLRFATRERISRGVRDGCGEGEGVEIFLDVGGGGSGTFVPGTHRDATSSARRSCGGEGYALALRPQRGAKGARRGRRRASPTVRARGGGEERADSTLSRETQQAHRRHARAVSARLRDARRRPRGGGDSKARRAVSGSEREASDCNSNISRRVSSHSQVCISRETQKSVLPLLVAIRSSRARRAARPLDMSGETILRGDLPG